jgi:hypothetical protein
MGAIRTILTFSCTHCLTSHPLNQENVTYRTGFWYAICWIHSRYSKPLFLKPIVETASRPCRNLALLAHLHHSSPEQRSQLELLLNDLTAHFEFPPRQVKVEMNCFRILCPELQIAAMKWTIYEGWVVWIKCKALSFPLANSRSQPGKSRGWEW